MSTKQIFFIHILYFLVNSISFVLNLFTASTPESPLLFSGQSQRANKEVRKRNLPRRYSNNTSSSDDPSPTEEVLEEARQRLRNLELESEEIDRNFREYRQRHPDVTVINDGEQQESDRGKINYFY